MAVAWRVNLSPTSSLGALDDQLRHYRLPPTPAMDSLPQEIIDEIIDNLPHSSLRSSSLVARRWRKRSQQRAFNSTIRFRAECMANSWDTDIQSDPGGISSYVQFVGFTHIDGWRDPALLGRVLKKFNSLTTLEISGGGIPNEMVERISRGELGRRLTALHLRSLRCSLSALISIILAFPDLRDLIIHDLRIVKETPSTYSVPPSRRPLDSLLVRGRGSGPVAKALANHRFSSRRLTLDAQPQNIQKLLVVSSLAIVELVLVGVCSLNVNREIISDDFADLQDQSTSRLIDLPPFPTLSSLEIFVAGRNPSPHLINTLYPISSVPALASIVLGRQLFTFEPVASIGWDHLDKWLVQRADSATVEGGLVLTLTRWRENWAPEVLLPRFSVVGKIITDLLNLKNGR